VFTLRLLGYDRTRNYDGSMGEWANREGTPLEK
jgi:3-mercaptopyruvate sulfurtransferase SseA